MADNDLAKQINDLMKTYTADVEEAIEDKAVLIATRTIAELKKTSPRSKAVNTKHYADGWGRRKVPGSFGGGSIGYYVYQREKPGLTHLLEKGHAKTGGGRVPGIKHIEPAEEKAVRDFEEEIVNAIEGLGN